MNDSLFFDRAVNFYDNTRQLPEPVATLGIRAILDVAGKDARILDVGTGTGRISVPLLKLGADLFGCDLSPKMMSVLKRKSPMASLIQADASRLPFPEASFDAVTTCHVMHLVGSWKEALREYRRILRPGGMYINAWDEETKGEAIQKQVREFWQSRVTELGGKAVHPGAQDEKELFDELRNIGADLEEIEIVRYTEVYTVGEAIEWFATRSPSLTWDVPDDIFARSIRELREWAKLELGDPNRKCSDESRFMLGVAHFTA